MIVFPFNISNIIKDVDNTPKWVSICKFVGTVAISLTFLTVMFFLGPTQGYDKMFAGKIIFLHLICPLLAIFSFSCTELKNALKPIELLYGIIPTILYGIVYFIMVMITKDWVDFYGFATVIPWYISIILMPMATYIICLLLNFLQILCRKIIKP